MTGDNPASQMLRSVLTALITATLISAAGAFVAIKIQERDIEENTRDVATLERELQEENNQHAAVDRRLTKLETSVGANERRHDENMGRISTQLSKLQEDMTALLRRRRR